MNEYKMKRIRYLDKLSGKWESPKYLKWCAERYHTNIWGTTMHHCLHKRVDYLLVPLQKEMHDYADEHRSEIFFAYLEKSVSILLDYLRDEYDVIYTLSDFEPETLKKLFEYVQFVEQA